MSNEYRKVSGFIDDVTKKMSDTEIEKKVNFYEALAFESMDPIVSEDYKGVANEFRKRLEERKAKRNEVFHASFGRFLMTVKNDRFIIGGGNDIHVTDLKLAKSQLQKVIDKIDEFI